MRSLVCSFAAMLLLMGCGEASAPGSVAPRLDSNTNWLRYCSNDVPCGELSCTCSICTLPCDPDACAALGSGARCARADEVALLEPSCGGDEVTTSLCVMGCSDDADCGDGRACLMGNCIEQIAGESDYDASDCAGDCRMQANAQAQQCLVAGTMGDDDCLAAASEVLDRCNSACGGETASPEQSQLRYFGYLCAGGLVLTGDVESPEEAAAVCASTDLGNPQLGGLRCLLGDAVVYDGCSSGGSGDAEALLGRYVVDFCDQDAVMQTEAISLAEARANCALTDIYNPQRVRCLWNDEVLLDRCDGAETNVDSAPAVDEACYLECRAFGDAVTHACRSYGYTDDLCVASGQAQFDSCAGQCASVGNNPLVTGP